MKKKINNKGFSILELLIYSVVVSAVLLAGTIFALEVIKGENKARSIQEVQNNANQIMELIVKAVRKADSVDQDQSLFDTHPGILVLNMSDPLKNPTVFSINTTNNSLEIREGTSESNKLNSFEVEISNMVFSDLTQGNSQENIHIELEVKYHNPNNLSEFETAFSLTQSVSIRK